MPVNAAPVPEHPYGHYEKIKMPGSKRIQMTDQGLVTVAFHADNPEERARWLALTSAKQSEHARTFHSHRDRMRAENAQLHNTVLALRNKSGGSDAQRITALERHLPRDLGVAQESIAHFNGEGLSFLHKHGDAEEIQHANEATAGTILDICRQYPDVHANLPHDFRMAYDVPYAYADQMRRLDSEQNAPRASRKHEPIVKVEDHSKRRSASPGPDRGPSGRSGRVREYGIKHEHIKHEHDIKREPRE